MDSGYEGPGRAGHEGGGKGGRRHGALGLVVDRRRGGSEAKQAREGKRECEHFFGLEERRRRSSDRGGASGDSHQRLG